MLGNAYKYHPRKRIKALCSVTTYKLIIRILEVGSRSLVQRAELQSWVLVVERRGEDHKLHGGPAVDSAVGVADAVAAAVVVCDACDRSRSYLDRHH
jgi:hypothetical protein